MNKIKAGLFIALSLLALPVFASPMVQRNCNPHDPLKITQQTGSVEASCEWKMRDDRDIQITLQSDDVTLIKGTCIFTPGGDRNANNAISRVWATKAGFIAEQKITDNIVTFVVRNQFSDKNINVLFYLNKADKEYAEVNKIHCAFSPIK